MVEDEMVGWCHRFSGHEFGHTPGETERREAWRALWSQSWTQLSDWTTTKYNNIKFSLNYFF